MRAQHSLIVVLGAVLALSVGEPALACSLAVQTGGTLKLSNDGTVLGSEVGLSSPATLTTVLSGLLQSAHIDIGAPTVTQSPAGYNAGQQQVQVAYTAGVLGVLSIANQGYTSSPTTIATGLLSNVTVTLTVHNRIVNSAGFAAGSYQTRTTVTCRP